MYLDPLHQIHAFPMFLRSPERRPPHFLERAASPQQRELGKQTLIMARKGCMDVKVRVGN